MKKLTKAVLSSLLVFCLKTNTINAQQGFTKVYNFFPGVDNFSYVITEKDTIYCYGVAYDTVTPSPQQLWMVKLDTFGNVLQSRLYRDSLDAFLSLYYARGNVVKTHEGHFAFAAGILGRASVALIKVDKNLKVRSFYEYPVGNTYGDSYESILVLPDSGFLIAGYTSRLNDKSDGFIRRIDKNGQQLWLKYYGDYNKDENFRTIVKLDENRFAVGGFAGPDGFNGITSRAGIWIVDTNGVVLNSWLGPETPNLLTIIHLLPTPDGGLIGNGRVYLGEGEWGSKVQICLLKFDSNLQLQWIKPIGPSSSNFNGVYDMIATPDGHYLLAGQRTQYIDLSLPSTDWGGWLYKFSEQGDSIWSRADNAPPGYEPDGGFVYGSVSTLSSGSIVAGGEGYIDGQFVGWVVKVSPDGCMDTLFCQPVSGIAPEPEEGDTFRVYPNPAEDRLHIMVSGAAYTRTIQVFDMAGKVVHQEDLPANQAHITLRLDGLHPGVFAVRIRGDDTLNLVRKFAVGH